MFTLTTRLSMLRACLTKNSPFYVQYYINARCNLMCKQCNIVESNSDAREAPLEDVEKIARSLRKIGAGVVLLTGGEPFLRTDLPEMVRIFKKERLDVRLQTAGMRVATEEALRACVEAGARDVNVSLDSLHESKQDYINSVPGSFREALETIARISRVFPAKGSVLGLGCVLSRWNFREIPTVLRVATRIGWYLSLVPVHVTPLDKPRGFRSYDRSLLLRQEDHRELDRVLDKLSAMKKEGYLLFDSDRFLASAREYLKTGRPTWRNKGVCDSPSLYFAVRPNGDIAVCCDFKVPGVPLSLTDPDFPRAYRSGAFRGRVRKVAKACEGCHYGSYPEMTIFARDPWAVVERTLLELRTRRAARPALSGDELRAIVAEEKAKDPGLYGATGGTDAELAKTVVAWTDPDGRKKLQQDYRAQRLAEGRIRGTPPREPLGGALK
jgi:MoaA/NifB/PqqE/SkfB family radical SAM enzyme